MAEDDEYEGVMEEKNREKKEDDEVMKRIGKNDGNPKAKKESSLRTIAFGKPVSKDQSGFFFPFFPPFILFIYLF
jgi:hypothetical protein